MEKARCPLAARPLTGPSFFFCDKLWVCVGVCGCGFAVAQRATTSGSRRSTVDSLSNVRTGDQWMIRTVVVVVVAGGLAGLGVLCWLAGEARAASWGRSMMMGVWPYPRARTAVARDRLLRRPS